MRLGYSYHIPALVQADGSILTAGYQSRFLEGLAAEFESLTCFLHTPSDVDLRLMDTRLLARNLRVIQIGPHDSVPRRLSRTRGVVKTIKEEAVGLDAVLLRGPSPLLPAIAEGLRTIPRALLLVGDCVEGLQCLTQPWVRRKLVEGYTHWNAWRQKRLCREVLTLVNSRRLFEQFSPVARRLREVRTTTLTENDFYMRADTCEQSPLRLLYTGRLEAQKGLLLILDALQRLRSAGHQFVFRFAGWSTQGHDFVEAIYQHAENLGIRDCIEYLGYRTIGLELMQCYRDSDVYVIASEAEGFPRTIWEAMGSSLPVVATQVGSIPAFLRDGADAVLVPPRDASTLADGIRRVVEDGHLRRRLIANGFKLAQQQTIEATVPVICDAIRDWIRECRERRVGSEADPAAAI